MLSAGFVCCNTFSLEKSIKNVTRRYSVTEDNRGRSDLHIVGLISDNNA